MFSKTSIFLALYPSVHRSIMLLLPREGHFSVITMGTTTKDMKMPLFTFLTHSSPEDSIFNTLSNHALPGEDYKPPPTAPPHYFIISFPPLFFNISYLLCLSFSIRLPLSFLLDHTSHTSTKFHNAEKYSSFPFLQCSS